MNKVRSSVHVALKGARSHRPDLNPFPFISQAVKSDVTRQLTVTQREVETGWQKGICVRFLKLLSVQKNKLKTEVFKLYLHGHTLQFPFRMTTNTTERLNKNYLKHIFLKCKFKAQLFVTTLLFAQ